MIVVMMIGYGEHHDDALHGYYSYGDHDHHCNDDHDESKESNNGHGNDNDHDPDYKDNTNFNAISLVTFKVVGVTHTMAMVTTGANW